jgi:uncharacterized protein YwbE
MISRRIGGHEVKYIVRDKDSKSGKVTRGSGRDVTQILDPNHCIKVFTRKWNGLARIQKQHLHGLKERVMTFLWTVIRHSITIEGKLAMGWKAINHYEEDHTSCRFPQQKGYIWRPKDRDAALENLMSVISRRSDSELPT